MKVLQGDCTLSTRIQVSEDCSNASLDQGQLRVNLRQLCSRFLLNDAVWSVSPPVRQDQRISDLSVDFAVEMQSLNVWHSELNTIVQHCLCTKALAASLLWSISSHNYLDATRIWKAGIIWLMLEIKISSKCHNEKSCQHDSSFLNQWLKCRTPWSVFSNLISFSLLGPLHSMLLSPLSNSRSVSLNDTYTVRFLVCIQNSTKNTGMFLTFCIEVRDSPPVMPRISELEVHPGSPPSMMLNASSMLLTWDRNTWIFGRLGEHLVIWKMNVWVKLLSLGCEYTKMLYKITRHFNCQYQLPVKILCMFCWSRF